MYFLSGERIYINPKNACATLEEQLQNCLLQLSGINRGKKIFKINFFVDTITKTDYNEVQKIIRKEVDSQFHNKILISVIAQPPITRKIIAEVSFYDSHLWKTNFLMENGNGAVLFENGSCKVLIGNVQSNLNHNCNFNSTKAFADLANIFNSFGLPINSIVRQWNYLEDILGFDGEEQRYQEFNNARTSFYGDAFDKMGYPSATGIGMKQGGIIIEFVAVKSDICKSAPINNPWQIAAHTYSENVLEGEGCVLKTTPKFERARYLELYGKKLIFISGTASIAGEKTVGVGNPEKQTEITISNIKQLYSKEILDKISDLPLTPKYGHARVYLKDKRIFLLSNEHLDIILATFLWYILSQIFVEKISLLKLRGK